MQVISSPSSSNPNFALFSAPSPNPPCKFSFRSTLRNLPSPPLLPPPCSAPRGLVSPLLEPEARNVASEEEKLLLNRRPLLEDSGEAEAEAEEEEDDGDSGSSSAIDAGLMEMAKKMPIFEPGRVGASGPREDRPLKINLDLALYRAKVLQRQFRYAEAADILQKCILKWPEDGRPYVALGMVLRKQSRTAEARAVYEIGCQATQGENPFIWQCWAVMETKVGNVRRARELFDAAIVADKKHIASWHGWAMLELKQGNIRKARHLLGKGLKFCGGNEYIYQTLALLEAKADRHEQAQYLFKQATKCNPKSCASWLAWAQSEVQQENFRAARQLFEKAIQSSPKNRFAWHIWGVFEAKVGNTEKGRKLLSIGYALNPRDAVTLQSLALLEYKTSAVELARVLFRRAAELNPRHQPIWVAWGWMEWKEDNIAKAREYYQRALSIDSTSENAARCLQAWGALEQKLGNVSAARRLFRTSLNINSQSFITWMTWASMEEDLGNPIRAEEIRNLYYQQRTEVVDDASWVMGLLDVIDPALERIKNLLNMDRETFKGQDPIRYVAEAYPPRSGESEEVGSAADMDSGTGFDLDAFVRNNLNLDVSKLDELIVASEGSESPRIWRRRK